MGQTVCSKSDNYCKKLGAYIAAKRALKGVENKVVRWIWRHIRSRTSLKNNHMNNTSFWNKTFVASVICAVALLIAGATLKMRLLMIFSDVVLTISIVVFIVISAISFVKATFRLKKDADTKKDSS